MKQRILTDKLSEVFEAKSDNCAEWFGYYNYDTLNNDQTKILCNKRKSESSKILSTDHIELGYYDLQDNSWHLIGYSDSFNWQQGSMLQWLPGAGNENKVIYNCSREGSLKSCIHNIDKGDDTIIDWPIYGITPDGKKSIALDLERSYWCRAYHYQSVANKSKDGRVLNGDGIFEIDLENNSRKLLVDINDIISLDADPNFTLMKHWIEHIMVSPNGKRFCFLHRFSPVDNVGKYQTRLLIADIDGSNLQVISGWRNYLWSHFGWQNDNAFAIYSSKKISLSSSSTQANKVVKYTSKSYKTKRFVIELIKKFIPTNLKNKVQNSGYQHYEMDENGAFILKETWSGYMFGVDGHPSFTNDGKYMLTDSYPDEHNMRRYIVFNTTNRKGLIIAQMPENKSEGNSACDLHPKLSRDNQYVAFDNTSTGKHTLLLLNINWFKIIKSIG